MTINSFFEQEQIYFLPQSFFLTTSTGAILEGKGMGVIFQKKGKEMLKEGKIFENLGKYVQIYI